MKVTNATRSKDRFFVLAAASAMCVAVAIAMPSRAYADESDTPVKISHETLTGQEYQTFPLPDYAESLSGDLLMRIDQAASGRDLNIAIFEAKAAELAYRKPMGFDEYVLILAGQLKLTDPSGDVQIFEVGDSVFIPNGFHGKWEMIGDPFRELAIWANNDDPEEDVADGDDE